MWYKYTTRFSVHYNGNMFGSIVQKKTCQAKTKIQRVRVNMLLCVFSALFF